MAHFDIHRLDTGVLVIAQELPPDRVPTTPPLWSGDAPDREAALQQAKAAWVPIYAAHQQARAEAEAAAARAQAETESQRAAQREKDRALREQQQKKAAAEAQAKAAAKAAAEKAERDATLTVNLAIGLVTAGRIPAATKMLKDAPEHPLVALALQKLTTSGA